jgi:3-methyladenine DNA glycosylase AlkC
MAEALKNMFNAGFFEALSGALERVCPAFDRAAFLARIYDDDWEGRELKARMRHITLTLRARLPGDYRAALHSLRQAAASLDGFNFETMIFPDFVEVYGLDDWEVSIPALEQFTQQCSAEFAVRPFIMRDQARMMAQMLAWTGHPSPHLRRLASEGCRPRLPWAMALPALKADPAPILPVLERLKADESEYVRRSVANNLNDIAKDHPDVVINTLRRWGAQDTLAMRALVSHALRTLVKAGHPTALELLGYTNEAAFAVKELTVEPATIPLGGTVTIAFAVESLGDKPQQALIDYVMHLMGANGQGRPKVFKLTKRTLAPGETLTIRKQHSFRPVTTRAYYPGEHVVEIQINGVRSGRCAFMVTG